MRTTWILTLWIGWTLSANLQATPVTPLAWQKRVADPDFTGAALVRKRLDLVCDVDANFVDDELQRLLRGKKAPRTLDVTVDLNRFLSPEQIEAVFGGFGRITYIGKLLTFFVLEGVPAARIPDLASQEAVAFVESNAATRLMSDVSSRAVQSRSSSEYASQSAEDFGWSGDGVTVAVVDSGSDEHHRALEDSWVEGHSVFATDTRNPTPAGKHGTHVSAIALGRTAGGSCSDCEGVAPKAGLVEVRACGSGACQRENVYAALDWVGMHHARLGMRAVNLSLAFAPNCDGSDALSQLVNYLMNLGITVVVALGNADNFGNAQAGDRRVMAPGAASLAITVSASDDKGSVDRGDDRLIEDHLCGPRIDYGRNPDPVALKPDLAAPGVKIRAAKMGTSTGYHSESGTSQAAPHVTGAAALIAQKYPDIDPLSLKDLLLRSADHTRNCMGLDECDSLAGSHCIGLPDGYGYEWDPAFGHGILNVGMALSVDPVVDLRFPADDPIVLADPFQVGVLNLIRARVVNPDEEDANAWLYFGVYPSSVGQNQFYHLGTRIITVPAGSEITVELPWTPEDASHTLLQARIAFGEDRCFSNNSVIHQVGMRPAGKDLTPLFEVRVENSFMVRARYRVETLAREPTWACRLSDPGQASFQLHPFDDPPRILQVEVQPPAIPVAGEEAVCVVKVYAAPEGRQLEPLGEAILRAVVP